VKSNNFPDISSIENNNKIQVKKKRGASMLPQGSSVNLVPVKESLLTNWGLSILTARFIIEVSEINNSTKNTLPWATYIHVKS
jgi:hypothetical protein